MAENTPKMQRTSKQLLLVKMSRVKRDKNDRGRKILRHDSFKMLLDDIREGFSTDEYTTNARLAIVESIERLRLPDLGIIL